jgi:hypothetical protein
MTIQYQAFPPPQSDFKAVFEDLKSHDDFYRFLQNIYRLYPEDRFHTLIKEKSATLPNDEAIYRSVQSELKTIKPFLADLTYALPSLFRQKKEIARQTLLLLGDKRKLNGYVEIGSTGRYISELRNHISIEGSCVLVNDLAPTNSPVDIVERGGLKKIGSWLALNDYEPMRELSAESADVVTCYIGLHHAPLDRLGAFIESAASGLRSGGLFILRDHDVTTTSMNSFVGLAHAVFNLGLNTPWATNAAELRFFRPIEQWIAILAEYGLRFQGQKILQAHDPSDNVLMAFEKI